MKKVKKIVLAALMVAVMAFALCSCGSAKVDGTYVISDYNGQSLDVALDQFKAAGVEFSADQLCTFTFANGKDVTITFMGESKTGTYTIDGETITFTLDGESASATVKDGKIVWTKDGQRMTLAKK